MSVVINIVLILLSIVLIVAVLMQEGNKQGLGAIGGAAETFLGKNKSKSVEGKLLSITKIAASVFVVIAILATWLNARTWTVRYFYEDGTEYYPIVESSAYAQAYLYGQQVTYDEMLASTPEDQRVASYGKDANIIKYATPLKEGYNGVWDVELPDKMDGKNYELHPIYTIGTYTLTLNLTSVPDENGDSEISELYAVTAEYQSELDVDAINAVIEALPAVEGYTVVVDSEIPATMPGVDTLISVSYEAVEEEAAEEEAETEGTTEEPVEEPVEEAVEEPADKVAEEQPTETNAE